MNERVRSVRENTSGNAKLGGKSGLAWNPYALGYGVFMFIVMTVLYFRSNPERSVIDSGQLVQLSISFVICVGCSYALSEWYRRRIKRQEEEDR